MKARFFLGTVVAGVLGLLLILRYAAGGKAEAVSGKSIGEPARALRADEAGRQEDPPNQPAQPSTAVDDPAIAAQAAFDSETQRRTDHLKQWGLHFHIHARKQGGRFPSSFEEVAIRLPVEEQGTFLDLATNQFEVIWHGRVSQLARPEETIVFREKEARRAPRGEWVKVYGFADGSVKTHTETGEVGFQAWEQRRMVSGSGGRAGT
jgi:hypothetical protein